jgi:hypothetical protein
MTCPNCGSETPDDGWNCVSCRINLYWASQHYDRLRSIRDEQGRPGTVASPTFLVAAHARVMDDRAERGHNVDNKVRIAARKVMRRSGDRSQGTSGREDDGDRGVRVGE